MAAVMRTFKRARNIFAIGMLLLIVMTACSSYTTIYFSKKKPQSKTAAVSSAVFNESLTQRTIVFMGGSSSREVMNDKAAEYILQGKFPQAEILLLSLLSDFPDCAQAYNNLGIVYESAGDMKKAFQNISKACVLEPDNCYYRKNLNSLDTAAYD